MGNTNVTKYMNGCRILTATYKRLIQDTKWAAQKQNHPEDFADYWHQTANIDFKNKSTILL